MIKIRVTIIVVLILALALGWFGLVSDEIRINSTFSASVTCAREYSNKGLYQKAITSYEDALKIKDSKQIQDELLAAYEAGFQDGVISDEKYIKAYETACDAYPKNADYWEKLVEYYLQVQSYSKAQKSYNEAVKNGAKSEHLAELYDRVTYVFVGTSRDFSAVVSSPNGYWTVLKDGKWGVLSPDGRAYSECVYNYVAPVSSTGTIVYIADKDTRVCDLKHVVQYITDVSFENAGACSGSLVPVQSEDGKWRYLNCETGQYEAGSYDYASAYQDGHSVVCVNGKWSFISENGEPLGTESFEDVKLYENGEFCKDNVMIAKTDGRYRMFSPNGKSLNDFSAIDMDNYYGGAIAFQNEDHLWGFADTKGEVIVEPQFAMAKSFSNGLAAVSNGEAWGFAKPNGTVVLGYSYLFAGYFSNEGFCPVGDIPDSYYFIKLRK